jgi:hypothetical protein
LKKPPQINLASQAATLLTGYISDDHDGGETLITCSCLSLSLVSPRLPPPMIPPASSAILCRALGDGSAGGGWQCASPGIAYAVIEVRQGRSAEAARVLGGRGGVRGLRGLVGECGGELGDAVAVIAGGDGGETGGKGVVGYELVGCLAGWGLAVSCAAKDPSQR